MQSYIYAEIYKCRSTQKNINFNIKKDRFIDIVIN